MASPTSPYSSKALHVNHGELAVLQGLLLQTESERDSLMETVEQVHTSAVSHLHRMEQAKQEEFQALKHTFEREMEEVRREDERRVEQMEKHKELEIGLVGQEYSRNLTAVQNIMESEKGELVQWAAQLQRENEILNQQMVALEMDVSESHAGARERLDVAKEERNHVVAMLKDAFRNELVSRNIDHQERLLRYNASRVSELEALRTAHNAEMAALREEEALARATMINDHQQHAISLERQYQHKVDAQAEESRDKDDAFDLELSLKSKYSEELKAELQRCKKDITQLERDKLSIQSEYELASVKLDAMVKQNQDAIEEEKNVLTALKEDLLKEREGRARDRKMAEDGRVAQAQADRNARSEMQKCHERELEGMRDKISKIQEDAKRETKKMLQKSIEAKSEMTSVQMAEQTALDTIKMLEIEIQKLKDQVTSESNRADEAMAERRKALMDAENANQAEKKSLVDSMRAEPDRLSSTMKKSALRCLLRVQHNGTHGDMMEALVEWKFNASEDRAVTQKKEGTVTQMLQRVINNWIYVKRTRSVTQWRANHFFAMSHGRLEEDCMVHQKARSIAEVEITVLKNKLKKNERNYQSELEAAIRAREMLEKILADNAGKEAASKVNELVAESSKEIQRRKEAEASLNEFLVAVRDTFGPGAGIEHVQETKIALIKAEAKARNAEEELATLRSAPNTIQKLINNLMKERDQAMEAYEALTATVKHSASGQVAVSFFELKREYETLKRETEENSREKSLILMRRVYIRWANKLLSESMSNWRERSSQEGAVKKVTSHKDSEIDRIRKNLQDREEALARLEEEAIENAGRVKDDMEAWQRKTKLRDMTQRRKEQMDTANLTDKLREKDQHITSLERKIKALEIKLENSGNTGATAEYLEKLEVVLEKARDRIDILERQNPGVRTL